MPTQNIHIQNTLFISAGAGSGKTYRLTNDLADYLSGTNNNGHNPGLVKIEPSQVIATTYTNEAAEEIKARARQELLKSNTAAGIQQATQLETAAIGTIHSVAQHFLNKYWYLLGSCPNQDVLTDEDKEIYRNQSLAKLFNGSAFTTERADIQKYYEQFQPTKYNDRNIPEPYPDFWAEHVDLIVHRKTYFEIDNFTTSLAESFKEIDAIFITGATVSPARYTAIIKAFEQELTNQGDAESLKTLHKLSAQPTYSSIVKLYDLVPAAEAGGKSFTQEKTDLVSWLTSQQHGSILKNCIQAVFNIADGWINDYEAFKRSRGVIDFDDMEKGFYRLIKDYRKNVDVDDNVDVDSDDRIDNAEVLSDIKSTYRLVMVDEFQDCNPIQLRIFARLSEIISTPDNRLPYSSIWVGDPNQSIYEFRGSDTDLINRVGSLFQKPYNKSDKKGGGLVIDHLDTSYRSRDQLVDYANTVFNAPFFTAFTKLKHNPNSVYRTDPAIQQWDFQQAKRGDHNVLHSFARHLKYILDNHLYQIQPKDKKPTDSDSLRYIEPRDIAILAYKHDDVDEIAAALREEGVPASAPESKILDRAEVQLLLAILNLRTGAKGEDGNYSERPHELATLLRLWCGKSTEEVLSERADVVKGNLDWSAQHKSDLDPVRLALDHTRDLPLDQRITAIILELDLYDRVSMWGDAEVRRQNLKTLQTVAQQFVARCHRLSIPPTEKEFSLYLQKAKIAPAKDKTSNSVKVYTYHGSKGLEWPMVILATLTHDPFHSFSEREFYGVHEIQLPGSNTIRDYYIHYIPAISGSILSLHKSHIDSSSIVTNARATTIDEQKRLFYVGATRARDYLVYYFTPTVLKGKKTVDVRWPQDAKWLDSIGIKEPQILDRQYVASVDSEYKEPAVLAEPTLQTVPETKHKNESDKAFEKRIAAALKYNDEDYPRLKAEHEAAQAAEDARRAALKNKPYDLHDLQPLTSDKLPAKYLHPSELPGKQSKGSQDAQEPREYTFQPLPGATPIAIPEKSDDLHYTDTAFGSCIHNIFAAYPYGSRHQLTDDERQAYLSTAKTIISNYGLERVITDAAADQLITNLLAMFQWLDQSFGPATHVVHEYPFNYPYGPIQNSKFKIQNSPNVVRGEIDLVYCTAKTDVIIDFKNFHQDPSWLLARTKDHEVHYVGTHYVAQLSMYKQIWQQANPDKEIKTYLYYDILGGVVEV